LELKTGKKKMKSRESTKYRKLELFDKNTNSRNALRPEQPAIALPTISSCREALRKNTNNQPGARSNSKNSALLISQGKMLGKKEHSANSVQTIIKR